MLFRFGLGFVLFALLCVCIAARNMRRAGCGRALTAIVAVALLAGGVFPFFVTAFGGSMVAPEMSALVFVPAAALNLFLSCYGVLLFLRWLVGVALRLAAGSERSVRSRAAEYVLVLLAAATALWGYWQATGPARVVDVEVRLAKLPEELEGLTIVQMSDLHASAIVNDRRIAAAVDTVNALKPDLVVLTGDFVDGRVRTRLEDLAPLKRLAAPLGVWGCEGNHEHYVEYEGWRKALPTLGVHMLHNAGVVLTHRGAQLILAGLTDPKAAVFGRELPDLDKALAGLQKREGEKLPVILLSHQPKNARYYVGRADLMLSGHTHGGQVFLFSPWVWVMNSGFVRGLYEVADKEHPDVRPMQLYVNQGLYAWAGFALRLGTHGEITRITLRRAP